MKKTLMGAAAIAILSACGAADAPESQDASVPVSPAEAEINEAEVEETNASLRLYTLDCGELVADQTAFGSEGEYDGQTADMVVTCFLIRHPNGDLVWDAGLPDTISLLPDGQEIPGGKLTVPVTLQSQLNDLGVPPEDVEYFAFSHSHFDHVGNANLFAESTILTQQSEVDFMFGAGVEMGVVFPQLVEPLRDADIVTYDGDYDVFGDGRVTIVPATGHTPGHAVLRLDLENSGVVWLSGDLYHFERSRAEQIVPAFNFSKPDTLTAMAAIEARIEADNGRLVIQHVPAHRAELPVLPDYLD
jgi:glyoxylase-like metal-dependent hydrolase (beta-lactamase superfamily II)